jgi:hypothetical protein
MSYDMIDRFLRNNLGDDDYAYYSAALDVAIHEATPAVKIDDDRSFGLIENRPRIACAAEKSSATDFIIAGVRHNDRLMVNSWDQLVGGRPKDVIQGFVDNMGGFHTREEAMILAKSSGQTLINLNIGQVKLFSENLY